MSVHHSVSDDNEEEEVGGAQRAELRLAISEDEEEAGPFSDLTALVMRYRHGDRRCCVLLCVGGVIVFTAGKQMPIILTD